MVAKAPAEAEQPAAHVGTVEDEPQPLQPPPQRGRSHPRPLRQIGARQRWFGKVVAQDPPVGIVKLHDIFANI